MPGETPAPLLAPNPVTEPAFTPGDAGDARLEIFIARHRGRPDVYWWLLGVVGSVGWIGFAATAAWFVVDGHRRNVYDPYAYPALAFAVISHLGYLFRRRWSRVAVLFPYLLVTASDAYIGWMSARDFGPPAPYPDPFGPIREAIFVALFVGPAVLALISPLNRLAFGLEVPRDRLEAARVTYQRNRLAVVAAVLSFALAAVPLGFILALPVTVTAWWRSQVHGAGHPRVARVALALSGVGLLWTVAFFAFVS